LRGGFLQDLDGGAKLADHPLQLLDPILPGARQPSPLSDIAFAKLSRFGAGRIFALSWGSSFACFTLR
jgi:hypothetical protein